MVSLILLSMVLCVLFVPILAARGRDPMRALRRALLLCAGFNVIYGAALYMAAGLVAEKL